MLDTKTADSVPSSTPPAPRRPSLAFCFVVTALSVFLLGLLFVKTPITDYVVQASLAGRVVGGAEHAPSPATDPAKIESLLLQGDLLRRAVREAGIGPDDPADVLAMDAVIDGIRQHLHVDITAAPPRDLHVVVEFADYDRDAARRLVDAIGRQFMEAAALAVGQHVPSGEPEKLAERRNERWRVRETRHYEKKARQQLDNFLEAYFAKAESLAATQGTAEPAANLPAMESNPDWETQQRHVERLRSDRAALLVKLKPEHPQVREMDTEIAIAERRLSVTPQLIASKPKPSENPAAAKSVEFDRAEVLAVADDFRRLRIQYEQTLAVRDEAESLLAAEEANRSERIPATTVWMMQPARTTEIIGGRPSPARVAIALLASVTLGFLVAWYVARRSQPPTFRNAIEAEKILSLPVVADLRDDQPVRNSGQPRRRFRRAS